MNSETIINNSLNAKGVLIKSDAGKRIETLKLLMKLLSEDRKKILRANSKDLSVFKKSYDSAFLDRLTLDNGRFDHMLQSIEEIINLPDKVGKIYDKYKQKSGIITSKMTVPIGIILMVYESRPNVTIDAAALSIRTANSLILKGGKEIYYTNQAFASVIESVLQKSGFHRKSIQILYKNSRELLTELLTLDNSIDLVIPRGSRRLLEFVQKNSKIPLLMHLEGNCHIYVDKDADLKMAHKILVDAKLQRTSTCNTVESLLVHKKVANMFLPIVGEYFRKQSVSIRGDDRACKILEFADPAEENDWYREYLAKIISIKVVDSVEEAVAHINYYGSGHTDSIITQNQKSADIFLKEVDSSSVMVNTSTRFADGFEYGLGAEIGISTNKLHARGPVGQDGLLTYKWIVESNGRAKGDIVVEEK